MVGQKMEDDYRNNIMIGLRIGGNYSNVYQASGEKFVAKGKYGSAVGIFVAIPINKWVGVQPEVMYSQKGFKATGELLAVPYEFTRNTEYIDVPLYFTIKPTEFFTFLAGPQFSFLTKKTDVFTISGNSVIQETTFNNENYRKNSLGIATGFDFNFTHVIIGTRLAYDLQSNNSDGTPTTPNYRNMLLQATFGLRF